MADQKADSGFDEDAAGHRMDLVSRMAAAMGVDTLKNLSGLSVLIIGLRGVGIETAKNLVLTGPKSVTLFDNNITQIADLGANFFLKPEHVGEVSRAKASAKSLSELNPYTDVFVHSEELTDAVIQSFGAVVVADTLPKAELLRINNACRTAKAGAAAFILAVTHGVTGHVFCDFGDEHVVTDGDGEPSKTLVVDEWHEGLVITVAAKQHGFDDDDMIKFEDIEGLPVSGDGVSLVVLNGATDIKVKRIYQKYTVRGADGKNQEREKQVFNSFKLDLSSAKDADGKAIDADKLGGWKTGGLVTGLKAKKTLVFRSLEQSLLTPSTGGFQDLFGPIHPDQRAWQEGVGKTLHLCYQAVLEFQAEKGHFPRLHNTDDSSAVLKIVRDLNEANAKEDGRITVESVDEKRVRAYSWYFVTELTGYAAFLGGVAAQEVVKKFGKYTPVHQWLHSDHPNLIGKEVPSDAIPQNSRYDHQIAIFGKAFQNRIANQKIFLVGCGALGCEYLKGLALMGACTGPNGYLWCTDMDRIEISNLSRQFLFRARHVGKPKSSTAAQASCEMNPSLNVEAREMKVCPETENEFDDQFWDNLDLCWNALDNVFARKYTDSKCLFHSKPLLESGTQGTKCNSEVILPYKTKTYNDGEEQETEGIAMCTLQNFPYLNTHCIEWARSAFTGLFEAAPKSFNTFVDNVDKFFEQVETAQGKEKLEMLQDVKRLVDGQTGGLSYESCVRLAFGEMVEQHVTRIKNLTHWFPDTHQTDAGTPFWSGHKRFPQIPEFSTDNKLVMDYLHYCGNLFAFAVGAKPIPKENKKDFVALIKKMNLKYPEWNKPSGPAVKVNEDEEEKNSGGVNAQQEEQIDNLIDELKKIDRSKLKQLEETEFEKDDDTNFHIDFITSCANMRAWNYRIKETSRHQCKIIAGKIIAALATTTAMICGLVELEFYKLLLGLGYINQTAFYNANINLGVSQFQFFEPDHALRNIKKDEVDPTDMQTKTIVPYPDQWTSWDKLVVDEENMTVQQFVDAFPKLFWGVTCNQLFSAGPMKEGKMIYDGTRTARSTKQLEMMQAKMNNEAQKKALQKQIDNIRVQNEKLTEGRDDKLIDRYVTLYGKLVSEKRNYVVLAGDFTDKDDNVALVPPIKFIFKK